MLNWIRKTAQQLLGETRGAEIAEAAAVLPLMFTMILGIFWFGQAFRIYGTITRAAQEGARAAAAPPCTTCVVATLPATNATNAVQGALAAAHLDPGQVVPLGSYVTPALFDCTSGASVACQNVGTPASNVCVQTRVRLSAPGPSGTVCGVSVSFDYPYQFWLPFTTLNKQRIKIQATARVRLETP
jgi:Flp pilus assembly protein TadG